MAEAAERADRDVVEHRHVGQDAQVLERPADAETGDAVGPHADDGAALETDFSLGRRDEAADQVEQRRLAGAVGPDQADQLVGVDMAGDGIDRDQPLEACG